MNIKANSTRYEDDGYCTVLAFGDDSLNPERYVILQITNNPSAQDIQLGQGGVHIELGQQMACGYNVLRRIERTSSGLMLTLDAAAAKKLGVDAQLEIELLVDSIAGSSVEEVVKVFQDRLFESK